MKLLILLFLLIFCQGANAQTEISAKEVIQKYLTAIGKTEDVQEVKRLKKYGYAEQGDYRQTIIEHLQDPDKYYLMTYVETDTLISIISGDQGVNIAQPGIFGMTPGLVDKYQWEAVMIPEAKYLSEEYTLSYSGIHELDDNTKCHKIGVLLPDSSMTNKAYNIETGLLELETRGKQERRILKYKTFQNVLFPSRYSVDGVIYQFDSIEVNPILKESLFTWNSPAEQKIIGRWEAETKKEGEKSQVNYFEFNSNRTGVEGIGLIVESELQPFMEEKIFGWELENGNIKFQLFNPNKRKFITKYLMIENQSSQKIEAYISDPDMDEKMGGNFKPLKMTFVKK